MQVAGLFHHASIGNPINIAIVRLILLEHEEVRPPRAGLGWAGLKNPPGVAWWPGWVWDKSGFDSWSWLVETGMMWWGEVWGGLWEHRGCRAGLGWFMGAQGLQSLVWGGLWDHRGCRAWFGLVYGNTGAVRWQRALGHWVACPGSSFGSGVSEVPPATSFTLTSTGAFPSPLPLDDFMFWLNHR